jgi:hypothetical protein
MAEHGYGLACIGGLKNWKLITVDGEVGREGLSPWYGRLINDIYGGEWSRVSGLFPLFALCDVQHQHQYRHYRSSTHTSV